MQTPGMLFTLLAKQDKEEKGNKKKKKKRETRNGGGKKKKRKKEKKKNDRELNVINSHNAFFFRSDDVIYVNLYRDKQKNTLTIPFNALS